MKKLQDYDSWSMLLPPCAKLCLLCSPPLPLPVRFLCSAAGLDASNQASTHELTIPNDVSALSLWIYCLPLVCVSARLWRIYSSGSSELFADGVLSAAAETLSHLLSTYDNSVATLCKFVTANKVCAHSEKTH